MVLEQERMQILKLLEAGKITAEEAAKLLAALNSGAETDQPEPSQQASPGKKKRRVRISVTDGPSGRHKEVNINLPIGVAKIVKRMKGNFPDFDGFKVDDILEAVEGSIDGEIIEVQDAEEGKRVKISIE